MHFWLCLRCQRGKQWRHPLASLVNLKARPETRRKLKKAEMSAHARYANQQTHKLNIKLIFIFSCRRD